MFDRRPVVAPTRNEWDREVHPAWGVIGASRVSAGPQGTALFDSDIRHQHTVVVRLATAERQRNLNRDWLGREKEFVEVEMSEAQWASFVSSMNSGNGVPCTIRRREREETPAFPFAPRLQESMDEVRGAASKAAQEVAAAFAAYTEKKTAANLRALEVAIRNMPANIAYAAETLSEHTENVVQKARADVEAMVYSKAQQLGLDPAELGTLELEAGPTETQP